MNKFFFPTVFHDEKEYGRLIFFKAVKMLPGNGEFKQACYQIKKKLRYGHWNSQNCQQPNTINFWSHLKIIDEYGCIIYTPFASTTLGSVHYIG